MITHILNGDSLLAQLPITIPGDRLVAKECLVDGPVTGDTLQALYETRSQFLSTAYTVDYTPVYYFEKTVPQFEAMRQLPADAEVNLWFEDDLFCQVNMWFVAHLLTSYTAVAEVYLIRPTADLRYGFGGMDEAAFQTAYDTRQALSPEQLKLFAQLWKHYQAHQLPEMTKLAQSAESTFPFLPAAVQAHLDRYPEDGGPGRPERSLRAIMAELGSDDFGPVFRAFWKQEAIYGFGDLQVKRIFDKMKE
jgi:hypothetical protein